MFFTVWWQHIFSVSSWWQLSNWLASTAICPVENLLNSIVCKLIGLGWYCSTELTISGSDSNSKEISEIKASSEQHRGRKFIFADRDHKWETLNCSCLYVVSFALDTNQEYIFFFHSVLTPLWGWSEHQNYLENFFEALCSGVTAAQEQCDTAACRNLQEFLHQAGSIFKLTEWGWHVVEGEWHAASLGPKLISRGETTHGQRAAQNTVFTVTHSCRCTMTQIMSQQWRRWKFSLYLI